MASVSHVVDGSDEPLVDNKSSGHVSCSQPVMASPTTHNTKKSIVSIDPKVTDKAAVVVTGTWPSKQAAIEAGYVGVKRSITDLQEQSRLTYTGGKLFVETEWLANNLDRLLGILGASVPCLVCGLRFDNDKRKLAAHIQVSHAMTSQDYTVRYVLGGVKPVCAFDGCDNTPRYASFEFNQYCKEHATVAMANGGSVGGKAASWNKGKTKATDDRIMRHAMSVTGVGNPFFGKKHAPAVKEELSSEKRLTEQEVGSRLSARSRDFTYPDFSYEEYTSRQFDKVLVKCVVCHNEERKTLQAIERGSLCNICHPFSASQDEIKIGDYIQNDLMLTVVRNDRSVISPLELDVYVPGKAFAVEFNGLYWHSQAVSNKHAHKTKTDKCRALGVSLFHVFSDEWDKNQSLIKSMIAAKLGLTQTRFGARELDVLDVSFPVRLREFFDASHISGYVKSTHGFALTDPKNNNEVLCALMLRKPIIGKRYRGLVEISRFATKPFTHVSGGFGKLLKAAEQWCKQQGFGGLLSYCDLRFGGEGSLYEKTGFTRERDTDLNYWYTDGRVRYDRFKFRARDGKSENEVVTEAGVRRIYGCGNAVYIKRLAV